MAHWNGPEVSNCSYVYVPMTQLHRIIRYANNKIRYILARTQPVLLNIDDGKGI